ncbi:MAG: hypothetical protein J6C33_07530, partial [Lachnospiraceae bacterium]|nr:hypothetical protein [Lachnospiraceae bacterium]
SKFGVFSSTAISISIVATNFPLIMLVLLSGTAVPGSFCSPNGGTCFTIFYGRISANRAKEYPELFHIPNTAGFRLSFAFRARLHIRHVPSPIFFELSYPFSTSISTSIFISIFCFYFPFLRFPRFAVTAALRSFQTLSVFSD